MKCTLKLLPIINCKLGRSVHEVSCQVASSELTWWLARCLKVLTSPVEANSGRVACSEANSRMASRASVSARAFTFCVTSPSAFQAPLTCSIFIMASSHSLQRVLGKGARLSPEITRPRSQAEWDEEAIQALE